MPLSRATSIPARPVAGRYRVERLLGRGGMGAVFQVRDEGTGRQLALKRLHAGASPKLSELFEREYRTLASLRHPRIVEVFEYGIDDAGAYYSMELLEGADLSQRAPMSWPATCACLRDLASMLGVLHSRRLVHRDLSPRNLWLTHDGRLKLLDFGALAPFGPATEVVGTPAFIAPETLQARALDQRTDLFALGALGYWLLTSTHAFRASQLAELPRAWAKPPAAPSSLAKLVQGGAENIPPELDRLIESLLRIDADERPRNTAEVIDRLNAIAGLAPEVEELVVEGYLESRVFVARERERDRAGRALVQADLGIPEALRVEGPEGIGRSRLLSELATAARLAGATVLFAAASSSSRPYEVALVLARQLLAALPYEARDLPEQTPSAAGADPLEQRARKQAALATWFLALSKPRTLVVIVDDLHAADEESQALVAALAHSEPGHRLLLVCSVASDGALAEQPSLRGFNVAARKLRLAPLSAAEMLELLRSVFGEVPYLERLAVRLHQISDGNPGHAWLLVRQLVRQGSVRYAEGAWTLPTDLPADLPSTLQSGLVAMLKGLPLELRQVARWLSLASHGVLTLPMIAALANATPEATARSVDRLIEQRVLRASHDGVQLAHPALREALRAELEPEERRRGQRVLAQLYAQQTDLLSQAHSGLHALQAGDFAASDARFLAVSRRIMSGEHESLRATVALFAEALELRRAAAGDDHAQIPLLSVLAVAGYQVDWSYAVRYGDDAVGALSRVLRFALARRLEPLIGGLPSLLVALTGSLFAMQRRRAGIRPLEAITWLVTVLGYLMGPAAMTLDRRRLLGYAAVFEPLLALGPDHGVAVVHQFCLALVVALEDRCAESQRRLRSVIERLQNPRPIRGFPDVNRRNLLAAANYTFGTRETFACDAHVLATADALDSGTTMHALQADQLRALHHSYRAELAQAASFEQRVEHKAIQLGSAWQAELVAPRHLARVAIWTHDVATHKRALQALTRLARDIPSFAISARWALGTDLVMRGKYSEALAALDLDEGPEPELGWTGVRAQLARAFNGLGQHDKARAVCRAASARLCADDRSFVILNLQIEIELALADAGLGALREADERLCALLEAHAQRGPLIIGALHRARVRVAMSSRDFEAAERQLAAMEACYRPTRIPSLLISTVELRAELRRAASHRAADDVQPLAGDDAHLLTRVELIMSSAANDVDDRPGFSALQVALELTGADHGFILNASASSPTLAIGAAAGEDVIAWARERLLTAADEEEHTAVSYEEASLTSHLTERVFGAVSYSVSVLWRVDEPIAALVLGSAGGPPAPLPAAVLRVLSEHLSNSRVGPTSSP